MHLEFNHFVSCLLFFFFFSFVCLADKKLIRLWWYFRMWLPVAAEATWYSWRQIIPSGGTLYQPVAMVTSQGQVLTQALPPGTIQIQNSQVKMSDRWCFGWHIHSLCVPSPPMFNLLLLKGRLYISQKPPRASFHCLCLNTAPRWQTKWK